MNLNYIYFLHLINNKIMCLLFINYLIGPCNWEHFGKNCANIFATTHMDFGEGTHGSSSWITRNKSGISGIFLDAIEIGKKSKCLDMFKLLQEHYPKVAEMIIDIVMKDNFAKRERKERRRNMTFLVEHWDYVDKKTMTQEQKDQEKAAKEQEKKAEAEEKPKKAAKGKHKKTKYGRHIISKAIAKDRQRRRDKRILKKAADRYNKKKSDGPGKYNKQELYKDIGFGDLKSNTDVFRFEYDKRINSNDDDGDIEIVDKKKKNMDHHADLSIMWEIGGDMDVDGEEKEKNKVKSNGKEEAD